MKETTPLEQDGERHTNEMNLLMRRRRKSWGGSSLSGGDAALSKEGITFKLLACQRLSFSLSLTNTFSHGVKLDRISHAEIISDMVCVSVFFFLFIVREWRKIKDKKMVNSKEREKDKERKTSIDTTLKALKHYSMVSWTRGKERKYATIVFTIIVQFHYDAKNEMHNTKKKKRPSHRRSLHQPDTREREEPINQ